MRRTGPRSEPSRPASRAVTPSATAPTANGRPGPRGSTTVGAGPTTAHASHVAHVAHEKHTGISCDAWVPATQPRCEPMCASRYVVMSASPEEASAAPDAHSLHVSHVSELQRARIISEAWAPAVRSGRSGDSMKPQVSIIDCTREGGVHVRDTGPRGRRLAAGSLHRATEETPGRPGDAPGRPAVTAGMPDRVAPDLRS
jgi:hypothetical protein